MAGSQHSEDGPEQSREVPQRGRRQQARVPAGSWLVAKQFPGSEEQEFGGVRGRSGQDAGQFRLSRLPAPSHTLWHVPLVTVLCRAPQAPPARKATGAQRPPLQREPRAAQVEEWPLPCPALDLSPIPASATASRRGGRSRGRADPPTASWAGACRGAAEPPPRPLTPHAGPLPPNLSLPQPLDVERLRGGWDPRVGQEGAPLPVGLTPVSRKPWRRDGWQACPRGREGLPLPEVGRSQQPATPWSRQGRCPAAQTLLGGLRGQNLPTPAATGREPGARPGHLCPPPPGTHLPCSVLPQLGPNLAS